MTDKEFKIQLLKYYQDPVAAQLRRGFIKYLKQYTRPGMSGLVFITDQERIIITPEGIQPIR